MIALHRYFRWAGILPLLLLLWSCAQGPENAADTLLRGQFQASQQAHERYLLARQTEPDAEADQRYVAALIDAIEVAESRRHFEQARMLRRWLADLQPREPEEGEYPRAIADNADLIAVARELMEAGEPIRARTLIDEHFDVAGRRSDDGLHLLVEILRRLEDVDAIETLVANWPACVERRCRAEVLFARLDDPDAAPPTPPLSDGQARWLAENLRSQGRWESAAYFLERFDSPRDLYTRAVYLYRAGDDIGASNLFERAAELSEEAGGQAWINVALFYHSRGEFDLASRAFDSAVARSFRELDQVTDDSDTIDEAEAHILFNLAAQTLFVMESGDVEAGLTDYERIFRRDADFLDRYISILEDAGYFATIRTLDLGDKVRRWQQRFDDWDLRRGTPEVRAEVLQRLSSGNLHSLITRLNRAGLYDISLRLATEELTQYLALAHRPDRNAPNSYFHGIVWMTRLTDWASHRAMLGPLLDPTGTFDALLAAMVGQHLASSGQFDEARRYLRLAISDGLEALVDVLASFYLDSANFEESAEFFEQRLYSVSDPAGQLTSILHRFELAGRTDEARRFLESLTEEPSLLHVVMPRKIYYDTEFGIDPTTSLQELTSIIANAEAIPEFYFANFVERMRSPAPRRRTRRQHRPTTEAELKEVVLNNALLESLETLAALGYVDLVAEVVDEFLTHDEDDESELANLRLRLAIVSGDAATIEEFLAEVEGFQDIILVPIARELLSLGLDEESHRVVNLALSRLRGARNHQAFFLHLGLLLLAGDEAALLPEIEAYIQRSHNPVTTRRAVIDLLDRLGRFEEALIQAQRLTELFPTAQNLQRALEAALRVGDGEAASDLMRRYLRVADSPIEYLTTLYFRGSLVVAPDLKLQLIEELHRLRPAHLHIRIELIGLLFAQGDTPRARELMLQTFEERQYHGEVVDLIVDMLLRRQHHSEIARTLGQVFRNRDLWPQLIIALALSEFALDSPQEADFWLQRLDNVTDHSDLRRLELADLLVQRQDFASLEVVIAPLMERPYQSPHTFYLRGLSRLAEGDESGIEDIDRANRGGIIRFTTHPVAIQAAIIGDLPDAARTLMSELLRVPGTDQNGIFHPLEILLQAATEVPGGAALARQFLEAERPRLLSDQFGNFSSLPLPELAALFVETDDVLGAMGLYRDRIWRSFFIAEDAPRFSTFFAGLAEVHGIAGETDSGMDAAYRALLMGTSFDADSVEILRSLLRERP